MQRPSQKPHAYMSVVDALSLTGTVCSAPAAVTTPGTATQECPRVPTAPATMQVVPLLQERVAAWKAMLPVAAALRSPQLQERHWQKLAEVLGDGAPPTDPAFTMQTLFDRQVGLSRPVSRHSYTPCSLKSSVLHAHEEGTATGLHRDSACALCQGASALAWIMRHHPLPPI